MYIGSFVKSLFRVRNIGATIFFILNLGVVFALFYFLEFFPIVSEQYNALVNGAIGIGINFVLLFFSLSPIGEAMLRRMQGMQSIEKYGDEGQRFNALFLQVYDNAKSKYKLSDKIKLYIVESNDVNAYALGHRTIALTRGACELNDDVLRGILAHEFGHIANSDSDVKLGIVCSNSVLFVVLAFVQLIVTVVALTIGAVLRKKIIGVLIASAINFLVLLLFRLWNKLGSLLANISSRKCEYLADEAAVKQGFGNELIDGLNTIDPNARRQPALSLISSTHPDTVSRIENIKQAIGLA